MTCTCNCTRNLGQTFSVFLFPSKIPFKNNVCHWILFKGINACTYYLCIKHDDLRQRDQLVGELAKWPGVDVGRAPLRTLQNVYEVGSLRSTFFMPSSHLCVVTNITEILLNIMLSYKFNQPIKLPDVICNIGNFGQLPYPLGLYLSLWIKDYCLKLPIVLITQPLLTKRGIFWSRTTYTVSQEPQCARFRRVLTFSRIV